MIPDKRLFNNKFDVLCVEVIKKCLKCCAKEWYMFLQTWSNTTIFYMNANVYALLQECELSSARGHWNLPLECPFYMNVLEILLNVLLFDISSCMHCNVGPVYIVKIQKLTINIRIKLRLWTNMWYLLYVIRFSFLIGKIKLEDS